MPMILPDDARILALAEALGKALVARRRQVATAESCTGGLVAGAITAIAGSSAWFDRGFVTYTNEAKCELLGVPAALIAREGAVSEAVARAMADGALARSQADLVVAVTGIAGPGGGSAGKPVGTVCFALGPAGRGRRHGHAAVRRGPGRGAVAVGGGGARRADRTNRLNGGLGLARMGLATSCRAVSRRGGVPCCVDDPLLRRARPLAATGG